MPLPFEFDFKNPDYEKVFDWRIANLNNIRRNPRALPALKKFYRENPAQFIIDWGCTADPRHAEIGLPVTIPFLLFPKQEEWINWTFENWKNRKPMATYKSRELGLSWLAIGFSVTLCLFYDDINIGFGSRKEMYVDELGNPDSLFWKARQFIKLLPEEFRGDWDEKKHSKSMLIDFAPTNSKMTGEAGDSIGRGGRKTLVVLDEAGHLKNPESIEAALSATTNCRIDISTPFGSNTPFARKCLSGNIPVFKFHWTEDPRKDQAWYEKKCKEIDDPVIIAQELDLDFNASMEGIVIPQEWVKAAIDAHIKLGFKPCGARFAALDVADKGRDLNALVGVHGNVIESVETWSGKDQPGAIFDTTARVISICDINGYDTVEYDADGLGAGVRGDAHVINKRREEEALKNGTQFYKIEFFPFSGAGEVVDKEKFPFRKEGERIIRLRDRTNEDLYQNAKSQGWFALRERFKQTFLAIRRKKEYELAKALAESNNEIFTEKEPVFNISDMISISSEIKDYWGLVSELSQPTYSDKDNGKILVDKTPDGARSPNRADAVMIAFAPKKKRRSFWDV